MKIGIRYGCDGFFPRQMTEINGSGRQRMSLGRASIQQKTAVIGRRFQLIKPLERRNL